MKFIFNKKKLHNISFVKNCCRAQKSKLMPIIKCTMLLKQLYYMYYNTRPKNAPKGFIIVCFHLIVFSLYVFDILNIYYQLHSQDHQMLHNYE